MDSGSLETRFHHGGEGRDERTVDLYADRLEALHSLSYLMRTDITSRERLETYLYLMDRVLAGMAADERIRQEATAA